MSSLLFKLCKNKLKWLLFFLSFGWLSDHSWRLTTPFWVAHAHKHGTVLEILRLNSNPCRMTQSYIIVLLSSQLTSSHRPHLTLYVWKRPVGSSCVHSDLQKTAASTSAQRLLWKASADLVLSSLTLRTSCRNHDKEEAAEHIGRTGGKLATFTVVNLIVNANSAKVSCCVVAISCLSRVTVDVCHKVKKSLCRRISNLVVTSIMWEPESTPPQNLWHVRYAS